MKNNYDFCFTVKLQFVILFVYKDLRGGPGPHGVLLACMVNDS